MFIRNTRIVDPESKFLCLRFFEKLGGGVIFVIVAKSESEPVSILSLTRNPPHVFILKYQIKNIYWTIFINCIKFDKLK